MKLATLTFKVWAKTLIDYQFWSNVRFNYQQRLWKISKQENMVFGCRPNIIMRLAQDMCQDVKLNTNNLEPYIITKGLAT